jgi:hypothetical protein
MQLIHESITQCSGLGGALCPGLQLRMLLRALANSDPAALLSVAMTIFNAYPILIKPDDTNFIVSVEFVDRGASAVGRILIDNGTMVGRQKENTGGYLIHVVSPEYDDTRHL